MKTNTPFISHRPALVLTTACSLALLLALGACGKKDEGQSVGQQLDSAVAKTEQAAIEQKPKPSHPWPRPVHP